MLEADHVAQKFRAVHDVCPDESPIARTLAMVPRVAEARRIERLPRQRTSVLDESRSSRERHGEATLEVFPAKAPYSDDCVHRMASCFGRCALRVGSVTVRALCTSRCATLDAAIGCAPPCAAGERPRSRQLRVWPVLATLNEKVACVAAMSAPHAAVPLTCMSGRAPPPMAAEDCTGRVRCLQLTADMHSLGA